MKRMMIAWLGNPFFQKGIRELKVKVRQVPFRPGHEVLDYPEIVSRLGEEPDLFLYADRSLAPPVVGLERFPCPTVFYCIDSHIHSWYRLWAQAFDFCLVSLRDHIPDFRMRLDESRLLWMPPMPQALHQPDPGAAKEWDLLFAGTVSREVTPERAGYLEALGRRFPGLVVRKGAFQELFPRARLVLNYAEKGDLNFRVFEALACESCLLTPMVGHGMDDLFTPGKHLFTYDPADLDGLVRLVNELLQDTPRRESVARAGYLEVEAAHRIIHRARRFLSFLDTHDLQAVVRERQALAPEILRSVLRPLYLHWAEALMGTDHAEQYLAAVRKG